MDTSQIFEETFRNIKTSELAVLRDIHRFPVYGQDIISEYLMVCINHSGTARALYDMQEVTFNPNEIAIVLPGHILRPLESSPDYTVTLLIHSVPLYEELRTRRLSRAHYKFHRMPACPLTEDDMAQFMKAVDMLEHICKASLQRYPFRHEMLIAQTNVMAEMINAYRRELDDKALSDIHKSGIFNDFCDLLALHYREQHEVAFYADHLHLSPRYFSVLVKEVVGLSASDYIEEYIASQAKSLLKTRPELSVLQISFHLGFSESPSFCRFFKRLTGLTPTAFREQ